MYSLIIQAINSLLHFSEEERKDFTGRLIYKKVERNDPILNAGEICKGFHFVNKGSFRQYCLNDHEEVTLNLMIENDWAFDHQSFTSQRPSTNVITASQDSEVLFLGMNEMHALIRKSPSYFALGRILENGAHNSYRQDLKSTPEEKYLQLLKNRPEIIQRFPLKHIASYLGMTPETISRVRKKIM
jgi:CRP-like cAMP-binding protein